MLLSAGSFSFENDWRTELFLQQFFDGVLSTDERKS